MALPTSTLPAPAPLFLAPPPASWGALTWRQLTGCWRCKILYGGNADVARAAALLSLCGLHPVDMTKGLFRDDDITTLRYDGKTGESLYYLQDGEGRLWTVTPRELSQMALQSLPWFDWPYGDQGEPVEKDEQGRVVKEARDPVRGYVNENFRDAMQLPEETIVVVGRRLLTVSEWREMKGKGDKAIHFALPSVACYNITWQQYRSLQAIAPQLFSDSITDEEVLSTHAQFMAHILVPARQPADREDPFAPPHDFTYDADRAEQTVGFWRQQLEASLDGRNNDITKYRNNGRAAQRHDDTASVLFHILFQVYQTSMFYYERTFPLLFNGSGKSDPLQDALTGETRTLNAVMKYQGYTKPEDVYAENLPNILSTLNTMAEEAKQVEQMNARIKRKT